MFAHNAKDPTSNEECTDEDFDGELRAGDTTQSVAVNGESSADQASGDDESLGLADWPTTPHPVDGRKVTPGSTKRLSKRRMLRKLNKELWKWAKTNRRGTGGAQTTRRCATPT